MGTQVVARFTLDGTVTPTVQTCSGSYPNADATSCIPCGPNTAYSSTLGCTCTNANEYWVAGGCYVNANASWTSTNSPTTSTADYLAEKDVVRC